MRRILYYSLLCLLWVSVNSCTDDVATQPPTPSFSVNRTSGLYQSTEFVFTIDQVGSNAVSLLPYGADHVNDAGIMIPASSFTNGKAIVKVVYNKVGTYQAVVVANNHTNDGLSVKNVLSTPIPITITSNRTAISEFTFDKSTKTVIDTVAKTITVTVPFGTDLTALKAKFTASDFSTVNVGTTPQKSGETPNNFTASPVNFDVKSQDAAKTTTWHVTVLVTPAEKTNMFKSFAGIFSKKDAKRNGRVLHADVDSAQNQIVVYDTLGSAAADFNAVALDFALKGSFAFARFEGGAKDGHHLKGKDTVSLAAPFKIQVAPQDSLLASPDGIKTFDVYFRDAPRLTLTFSALNPVVSNKVSEFTQNMEVLKGTVVSAIKSDFAFTLPAGATIAGIKVGNTAVVSGDNINYTKPVDLKVAVTQGGITYTVTYTITVTVVNK